MRSVSCFGLAALLLACPLAAQVDNSGAMRTVSVEFRGGTLSELIEALRQAGDGANIVASELADKVRLPPITLRDATVQAALMAVRPIVPEPYRVMVETQLGPGRPVHSVAVIKVQSAPTQMTPGPASPGVRVFSIRKLVEALPSDPKGFESKLLSAATVLSAIENGLEVGDQKAKWDLRYHEDSGLLFVSGSFEQLSLVHEILQALERDVDQARQAAIQVSWANDRGTPPQKGKNQ